MKKIVAVPTELLGKTNEELNKLGYGEFDLTPQEIAERLTEEAAFEDERVQLQKEAQRKAILVQLSDVDARSIRALRESNAERLAELEAQATVLRGELNSLGE